jgi:CRISPR-associated protein Csm5
MSIDQHWQLSITPLAPVHLGSGQDYEPTGYVIDEETLYEFDGIAALKALPEQERAKLSGILDGKPTQDMLRRVQSFFHSNRERLIAVSRRCVQVNATVEDFYRERIGQIAQHEARGQAVQNRLEIERTAFNPYSGAPILPGSGLKGAIRTALLDQVNEGRSLPADLRGDRNANLKLQQRLFAYQAGKFELDPMRLIRISDASAVDPDTAATQVRFAVNRKKAEVRVGGKLVDSQAEQRGLYQLLECLAPLQTRGFRAQLSVQQTGGIESRHWPDASLRFNPASIAAACNRFYLPALQREMTLLHERGYLDECWADDVRALLSGPLAESLSSDRAFVLRVGRHSGAESLTLNGIRQIKIIKGKGEKPDTLDHAKTIWLASDERLAQRDLLPFGWVLVELHNGDDALAPLTALAHSAEVVAWRTKVSERRARILDELAQAQARLAEAEKESQRVEREQAEREARLANLSDEARKLESLRELFRRDQASGIKLAGGELANTLVGLLKEAEQDWPAAESHALAELAEAIYGHIGWPASKKKRERQAQIAALFAKRAS